jgi:predicted phosphoadenosine phosphosulfate sulfurtransferase
MYKKKLIISFSGGRTSAYMLWWLFNEWTDRHNWDIIVVFANTGKEVENTLFFVDECSQEWNIPIVWVEAKCIDENGIPYSEKGWQVKHKIVTYETASRKGEPFEEMISILGIPSSEAPFCSYQLKKKAIESLAKAMCWDDYHVAIGIRSDETDRINENWITKKLFYPLATINPITKRQVSEWWGKQGFDLGIHPDDGNCDNCWKKDFPRLIRNAIRKPNSLEWWTDMQEKYGYYNPRKLEMTPPFNFYRGNKSTLDIKKMAQLTQAQLKQLAMFDVKDGCQESCEPF